MSEPIYNIPLPKRGRVQSGLGRARKDAKSNENVNDLLLAKVTKVNYLYNTVDVVTTDVKGEIFSQTPETKGKYSARVPVTFGGSLLNGMSYGETSPINVGDTVLIGFIRGTTSAPIVINVYKSDFVARDLAPTLADQSYVSGLPETPENFDLLFTKLQVYPAQTYHKVSGLGNIEHTLPGRVFFKTSTEFESNAYVDDAEFSYESLEGVIKRNGDIREPLEGVTPNILFQVPWSGVTENVTNIFFSDGLFRASNVFKNTNTNTHLFMDRTGDIGFKQLLNTYNPDFHKEIMADTDTNAVGIIGGNPTLRKQGHVIQVTEKGLEINGKTLEAMFEDYTRELQLVVTKLTRDVNAIADIVKEINLDDLAKMSQDIKRLDTSMQDITESFTEFKTATQNALNELTEFTTLQLQINERTGKDITALNTEIIDARGVFKTVAERLSSMTATIDNSLVDISNLTASVGSLRDDINTLQSKFTAPTSIGTDATYTVSGNQVALTLTGTGFPITLPDVIKPSATTHHQAPTVSTASTEGTTYGTAILKVTTGSIAILTVGEEHTIMPTTITYNK